MSIKSDFGRAARRLVSVVSALFLGIAVLEAALDLKITGTAWSRSISSADLQGAAGSDLTATYESLTNQLLFEIAGTTKGQNWRIDVKRTDTTWHASFVLSVQRNTGSDKDANLSGGLSYLAVSTSDQAFFTGHDNVKNIPIQERLGGVSCAIPAQSYSTTLTFTAVGL